MRTTKEIESLREHVKGLKAKVDAVHSFGPGVTASLHDMLDAQVAVLEAALRTEMNDIESSSFDQTLRWLAEDSEQSPEENWKQMLETGKP